jgi:hypothetical protein
MYEFARGAAATAPAGSALQMLPIEAHIEYLLYALDFTSSREERNAMLLPWLKDEQTRLDIDNALAHWFPQADSKHPHWYDDLNGLAYVCFWAQRLPDAKPVFEAIGDHATMRPWYWAGDPRAKFLDSRATALSS